MELITSQGAGFEGSVCCGEMRAPIGVAMCIGHDLDILGTTPGEPIVTAGVVVGCDRSHAPGGDRPPTDYGASDPGFAEFAARITNGIDDSLFVATLAVDSQLDAIPPGFASSPVESQWLLVGSPDLSDWTIRFLRLVIDTTSVGQDTLASGLNRNHLTAVARWEFWGVRQ